LKTGATGRGCGDEMRFDTFARKLGDGALKQMHVSRQASGDGVIDDGGALGAERFQDHIVNIREAPLIRQAENPRFMVSFRRAAFEPRNTCVAI
jgi:hypothetical protein